MSKFFQLVIVVVATLVATTNASVSAHASLLDGEAKQSGPLRTYGGYSLSLVVPGAKNAPTEEEAEGVIDILGSMFASSTNKDYDEGKIPFGIARSDFAVMAVKKDAGLPRAKFNVLIEFAPVIECLFEASYCPTLKEFDEALMATFSIELLYAIRKSEGGFFRTTNEGHISNSEILAVIPSQAPTPIPSMAPSQTPSTSPSGQPTPLHSGAPTSAPSYSPIGAPSSAPSKAPTRFKLLRTYDEYYLSFVVPGAKAPPTEEMAAEIAKVFSARFSYYMDIAYGSNKPVSDVNYKVGTVDFDAEMPSKDFNVMIQFVPSVHCLQDCPTPEEFNKVMMASLNSEDVYTIRKMQDGYWEQTNEVVVRNAHSLTIASTKVPTVATSTMPSVRPSASPSAAPYLRRSPTTAPQPMNGKSRTYEEYYLALAAPKTTANPKKTEVQAVLDLFASKFAEQSENAITSANFHIVSTEFGAGIPDAQYNVLIEFSPSIEITHLGHVPSDQQFDKNIVNSLSADLLEGIQKLPGFGSTEEAIVVVQSAKELMTTKPPSAAPSASPVAQTVKASSRSKSKTSPIVVELEKFVDAIEKSVSYIFESMMW